jgi:hypothetical protein
MGRECCRADTGTLSIRIHQRAVRFTPGRRLVTPRPGAPRQGREQPGPAAPRPWAVRIWRLFVIRHAAPDTRIPAVLGGSVGLGDDQIRRAELGDLCVHSEHLAPARNLLPFTGHARTWPRPVEWCLRNHPRRLWHHRAHHRRTGVIPAEPARMSGSCVVTAGGCGRSAGWRSQASGQGWGTPRKHPRTPHQCRTRRSA